MKKSIIRIVSILLVAVCMMAMFAGCEFEEDGSYVDTVNTKQAGDKIQKNQPTPTDIEYSLERYNLIRRAYWVNGQREKANALPCAIEKPLGYIILMTESGAIVGKFTVDGKVSSLNSFLTPDSEEYSSSHSEWLPDVDGSYGENDNGIFFFDVMGNYIEWTGLYLYTDIPMEIDDPMVNFEVAYTEVG